ncbi:hypothetical protein A2U01_0084320, partial [Trifolium medium]|nr:hypothetical protein [Trifolium medium]
MSLGLDGPVTADNPFPIWT